jgi:DnaJ family protein C protein 22
MADSLHRRHAGARRSVSPAPGGGDAPMGEEYAGGGTGDGGGPNDDNEGNEVAEGAPMASRGAAYLIWLTLGWCGGHHFYLGRDAHAFLWMTTFAGFGFGLLRELWRLPEYVDDANWEPSYMELLIAQSKRGRPWSVVRLIGMYIVGRWYGFVLRSVPTEAHASASEWLKVAAGVDIYQVAGVVGISAGVHLVGTLGRAQGRFAFVIAGAAVGQALDMNAELGPDDADAPDPYSVSGYNLLLAIVAFFVSCSWDVSPRRQRRKARRGRCKRATVLLLAVLLFWGGAARGAYEHGSIELEDQETDTPQTWRLREAWQNIINSPEWTQLRQALGELWQHYQTNGWSSTFNLFKEKLDVDGEDAAYRTLGLEADASGTPPSFDVVKKKYRELSKVYHPDRNPGDKSAEAKMIEINGAYETLTKLHPKTDRKTRSKARRGG